jgi:N-hydroxyarylamine O-acetyltransferase
MAQPDVGSLDLGAYLRRTGTDRPSAPSADALTELHRAHVGSIPFENLDVLMGVPIRLDLESLQAKLVTGRRGGYCFEHNSLFRAALEALGFTVTSLAARVRAGTSAIRPRTHMLLKVDVQEQAFLADVGFGADGLLTPLLLQPGREQWHAGTGHRLRHEEASWVLEGDTGVGAGWQDLYAFTLEPQHPVDFEMANHYTSTWPGSHFRSTLTAQLSLPQRRLALRDRDLVTREGGQVRTERVRDPDHLLEVLEQRFSLCFPKGTRFPRPEF